MKPLELFDIYNDHLVDENGYLTRVYPVTGYNISHYSQSEYDAYINSIHIFLNTIKRDFRFQIIRLSQVNKEDPLLNSKQPEDAFYKKSIQDMKDDLKQNPILNCDCFIAVTYINEEIKHDWLGRKKRIYCDPNSAIERLNDCEKTILNRLKLSPNLKASELFHLCFRIINPNKALYAMPDYNEAVCVSDQLHHSPIENQPEFLLMDGVAVGTINIELLPALADVSFIATLNGDGDTIVSVNFQKADQEKEQSQLKIRRNIIGSTSTLVQDIFGTTHSGSSDIQANQTQQEITDVIHCLATGEQELFVMSVCIVVIEKNKDQLKQRLQKMETRLQAIHKCHAKQDRYNHFDNLLSCLPSQSTRNKTMHLVTTDVLSVLLPFNVLFKGTSHEEVVLRSFSNQRLAISLSKSDLSSAHGIVLAPTGKGKSFTINYLIQQFMSNTSYTDITIIDRGGSYRKSCLVNNGQYMSLDLEKEYAINCFVSKSEFLKEEINKEKLVFLRQFLTLAISEENEESLKAYQEQLIEQSLVRFYETLEKDQPILSDYVDYLETLRLTDEEEVTFITRFRKSLRFYCDPKGAYHVLLNQPTSLNINNRFVVFDITKFKDHPRLERLYFFLINQVITEKMHALVKQGKQQLVFFDEAWKVLQNESSAQMVETLYREARKYGTKIICISHSGRDFTENEFVKIIPLNSEIKFILHHDKDKLDELQHLGLHDADFSWIANMQERQDVFCKFGQDRFVFSIKPTVFQNEICRTDAESIQKYESLCKSGDRNALLEVLSHA